MITLALLLLLSTSEMDPKMRLDLDIAEKILTELIQRNGAASTVIKGSHIPGYGVMLEVLYRQRIVRGQTPTELQIEPLIKQYLNEYGDLITGMSPDETISVTYSNRIAANRTILSVKKRDVSDRRSGKITEATFMSRIKTDKLSTTPDAEIFAKVVETAVNADTSRVFSLRNTTASVLPGYGLLVSGFLSSGFGSSPTAFTFTMEHGAELEMARAVAGRVQDVEIVRGAPVAIIRGRDSMDVKVEVSAEEIRGSLDGLRQDIVVMRNELERVGTQRRRSKEEMTAAYSALESQLKSVILDYGRTLNSLGNGQTLMVRITNDRAAEGLPQSLTFTVTKQVLNDFDRRAITKEQAVAKIVIVKD